MFQFVFETIENVGFDIFSLFQSVQKFYYIIYMFQCLETPGMGSGMFTFLCFSLLRNVSKQLKVWTKTFAACFNLFQ